MPLVPPPGPTRLLAVATFVNTFGNGLFFTGGVVFLVRSVGLSAGQVGLGMTIAGTVGLFAGVPFGHLGDRLGAREVLVVLMLLAAGATACLGLVRGFGSFLVVSSLITLLDRGASGVRQGLIAASFAPAERVRGRAYLRSVTNLGLALGAAAAGVALAVDTRPAYLALILGDAITWVIAALLLLRLPQTVRVERDEPTRMLLALRDRPFVVVTALNAVVTIDYAVLEIGIPLWVTEHTAAPRWSVALLFLVNTACCVLFQVRASRGSTDVPSSARAVRSGAVLIGVSCLLFAAAGGRSAALAVAVLVSAALVNVAGELYQAAGSWGLGFGLAPEHAQGQYQGLFGSGMAASSMVGPALVTATAISHGTVGWALLGLLILAAGVLTVPAAAWAARTRPVAVPAG